MYQRLSQTAKEVINLAEKMAQEAHKEYVGTEHLLLAILEHGLGVGGQVLLNCSITLPAVKERLEELGMNKGDETCVLGRLSGTPHFNRVLTYSIELAEKAQDSKVGTEYLLLGILKIKDSMAERALCSLGLTLQAAQNEVCRLQGRNQPENV